ncbi:ATP-grasp domain-containing protein, partial [Deinococcus pimensis]|uniref:ATP-grasp domain-containing protein n=1 Tax=Deinococcus pimensis TaxID=309888 RepID=UPI00146FA7FA
MTTVWFNKNFAVIRAYADALQLEGRRVLVSHTNADSPQLQGAAAAHLEPRGLVGEDYVAWALDFARRQDVDVFWPGKELAALARHREAFEAADVRLIVPAEPDTLDHLDDKAAFLRALPPFLRTPPFEVVTTWAEMHGAFERTLALGWTPCFKPARGVYGHGFRIVTPRRRLQDFLAGDTLRVTEEEARALFEPHEPFAPMLVMGCLPGVERSVDVVCWRGELGAAVVRAKLPGLHGSQVVERRPDVEALVRAAVAHYGLSGVVNVQFKDDADGAPHVLEINARPSGGSHMSALAGPDLPVWAVRLALGEASAGDVPP